MENNQKGMLYSLSAFILWGLFPLYWTNLKNIPALEIVSHRIIWSFFFLIIFVILKKQKNELVEIFKNKKTIYYIILF
ncbi:hypothetical protein [Cetobacterium sp. 2G large]|uniref:hypothetical protein n=1 Tax=Cetobacterium sp. 2G large TaxID=2759680 RepID=UPI00163C97B6|nr:hypothetical protein [Cetobacterium sp. 2G large]MBC2852445.1 hypothetical protein [Cetobacterium sp. 2G large]